MKRLALLVMTTTALTLGTSAALTFQAWDQFNPSTPGTPIAFTAIAFAGACPTSKPKSSDAQIMPKGSCQ